MYDFKTICRTCICSENLEPININQRENFLDMVFDTTGVEISLNDMYPQQICKTCTGKIESAYIFKQKCHEAFEKLRKYLETTSQTSVLKVPDNDNVAEDKYFICIDDSSWKYKTHQEDVKQETFNSLTLEGLLKAGSETLAITKISSNLDTTVRTPPGVIAMKTESLEYPKKHNEIENSLPLEYKTEKDNPIDNLIPKRKRRQISSSKSSRNKFNRLQQLIPKSQTLHCEVCVEDIARKNFYRHLKSHTEEPQKCNCEICGKELSRTNYSRHLKIHTGEKPHKCNMCDAAFITTTSLYEHQKTHSTAKDYLCQYCEKAFKQHAQLRYHIRLKHTEKCMIKDPIRRKRYKEQLSILKNGFECDQCHKIFSRREVLKTHQLIHGDISFLCNECGKGFKTSLGLQSHLKVHTGEKPFKCSTCDKSFSQMPTLRSHERVHTGIRPFICKVCNKSFKQGPHLKYHSRIHSGEKPYKCTVCSKQFTVNGTLTVHMRTHTGETPYLCPVCNKGFYDSSSMKKHRSKHTEV